ncbi:hypothetical protein DL93DRAFT_577460 [Clavulina sp. PMI_390]|nr:hypothetical protein DL93DRAFT_577460 [Clavulina sp. PMI_390]
MPNRPLSWQHSATFSSYFCLLASLNVEQHATPALVSRTASNVPMILVESLHYSSHDYFLPPRLSLQTLGTSKPYNRFYLATFVVL